MKIIFSAIIFVSFIFVANISFAQEVRVCDFGIEKFVSAYNKTASASGKANNFSAENILIKQQPKFVEKVEVGGYLYESYSAEIKNGENFANIVFLKNLDGYVSKIMLFSNSGNFLSKVSSTILFTLGLNQQEYSNFTKSLSENLNASIFCSATQRNIRHEFSQRKSGIFTVVLSAFTN